MRGWRAQSGLGILLVILLGRGLLSQAEAAGTITASPGYTVSLFATDLQSPTALGFGPQETFGGLLYVVERGSGQETGRLVALDSLAPAGPFGPALFVVDSSVGIIYRIAPVGR